MCDAAEARGPRSAELDNDKNPFVVGAALGITSYRGVVGSRTYGGERTGREMALGVGHGALTVMLSLAGV
jgi:hypothetical protein